MNTENFIHHRVACVTLTALLLFGIGNDICIAAPQVVAASDMQLEPLSNFPQTTLTILTPDARQHLFKIWVAATDAHREQGLMFVKSLEPNAGMLFTFDEPQQVNMWMKNTLISLDMVFIDSHGSIESIAANAKPQSLQIISSKGAVQAVLELKGGMAAQLGIRAGALVQLSR